MLLALWLLVVVAAVGLPPVPASTFSWDGFNGLGLAGLVLLLLCCWLAPARHSGYSVHGLRAHIGLCMMLLAAVTAHALGMLLSNDVAIEYLKWRAPAYMHAGNVAFLGLLTLSLISIRRVRRTLHSNFENFRRIHRWLSALIIMLTGWHLLGSGFLTASGHGLATAWTEDWTPPLGDYWRGWMLGLLLVLTTLLWWHQPQRQRPGFAITAAGSRRATATALLLLLLIGGSYLLVLQWGLFSSQESQ